MKAISIWQPWASLLACEAKKYETRSWGTNYRGPIAIHAAALSAFKAIRPVDDMSVKAMRQALKDRGLLTPSTDFRILPHGCIIATAELIGCHKIISANYNFVDVYENYGQTPLKLRTRNVSEEETIFFGNWESGRYAWEFANIKMLPEPIPTKGKQRLWEWEWPLAG